MNAATEPERPAGPLVDKILALQGVKMDFRVTGKMEKPEWAVLYHEDVVGWLYKGREAWMFRYNADDERIKGRGGLRFAKDDEAIKIIRKMRAAIKGTMKREVV